MARPPILTLRDISFGFGSHRLFDGLSLTIQPSDRLALVGRNGSGKSTLMKVIADLVEPETGTRTLTPGLSVGYMEQDPDFTPFSTLGDFIAAGLPAGDMYKAERAAQGLKLQPQLDPKHASGGERRRAALAGALASAPDLMLLDEPTNHLDIEAIDWLEAHLRATRTAYILISHDRRFLQALSQGTLWVDRGQVRRQEKGFAAFEDWRDQVFTEEDLDRHKLNRLIKSEAKWAVEGISARRKRNQGRVRRLAELRETRASQITRKGSAQLVFSSGQKSGKLVIEAEAICKSFETLPIIDNLSIKIAKGDRVAVVGPNGAGKTTLINLLTGVMAPDRGRVRLGANVHPVVFDQNRAQLDLNVSLWSALTDDPVLGGAGRNDQVMVRGQPRHVVSYLKDFLFDEEQARQPVSALSGGERARLLLAKIMARDSNMLVLDEPTNDLDIETLDVLQEVLADYDGTVLLVSHDRDFIDRIATLTIHMPGDGRAVVYAGGWSEVQAAAPESVAQDAKKKTTPRATEPQSPLAAKPQKLGFKDSHRLHELPAVIAKLEAEISRLEVFLSDPTLFSTAPEKFAKASEGLIERQSRLLAAESEWLELEERVDATRG